MIVVPRIAEIREITVSNDESSWMIGELIADGWFELNLIEIGSSPEYEFISSGQICVLGRPFSILPRKQNTPICQSIINSGRRSQKIVPGTNCHVPGCTNPAEYEVIFYDYYPGTDMVHFAQDFTCPFICEEHMQENEAMSRGERRPRSSISYPYSKKYGGQAYTKYLPASFTEI